MDITVAWPSAVAQKANIWRILDLSGMTKSVRNSRNFTRSGYVYLNSSLVNMKSMVEVGSTFTLELKFPNGKIISRTITLASTPYTAARQKRSNSPAEVNRQG